MKKNFLLLLSLVLLTSFIQNETTDEQYLNNILQEIVASDETILEKNHKLVDGFNSALQIPARFYLDEEYLDKLSPYFKKEDIEFYRSQITKNSKVKLLKKGVFKEYEFIRRKKIVNFIAKVESDYVKEKEFDYDKLFNKKIGAIQEFGLPLVSKDGKFVVIRFFKMSSSKANKGFIRIYERVNENWVLREVVQEWNNEKK
ncbi:hypothetical protein IMCC3317_00310 [Kordia antarctica]|uniref:Uncharacterized protein n=1 Tax=Kordia antarctica TaxID=1218801 RepID=A0A7L4ZCP3_9FLAO|nr:hypothetical protein [Kordia antarctica]QHI34688.1 hypothetical protein IMCC3317_00310 [Kordia antarctica]